MISALNQLVALIEERLTDELDVASMARSVGTTEHHLRRMFSSLASLPLSEYVRRRRMTVAAAEVIKEEAELLAIANRYGYGSTEAFNRAFRAVHGAGPADVRRDGGPLRAQPMLHFTLQVAGGDPIVTRIVRRPAFRLVGRSARVPLVHEGINPHIQQLLSDIPAEEHQRLRDLSDTEPLGILAVTDDLAPDRTEGSELTFLLGVAVSEGAQVPADLDRIDVAAGRWLVVDASGPQPHSVQQAWVDVWTAWFPSNPWRLRPGPELVANLTLDQGGATSRIAAELWIPVEPA